MSKNFLKGMGSVINPLPSSRKINIFTPSHTDEEAIFKDWEMVGYDLFAANKKITSEKLVIPENKSVEHNKS